MPVWTTPNSQTYRLAFDGGFTLAWAPPNNAQPERYLLDVAADSTFTRPVAGYTNLAVTTPNLRIGGLQPNVEYFYRVRAVAGGRATAYSPTARARTLAVRRFNADQTDLLGIVKSAFYQRLPRYACFGPAHYYSYVTGASLTFGQTDSLLAKLTDSGFPIDTAWAQDNSTCDGKNNGASELLVKLKQDDPRIRVLGFSKRYNDWASGCECRNYRVYYNFGSPVVSVRELAAAARAALECAPNPANEEATFSYELREAGWAEITLSDVLGREAARLAEGFRSAGAHTARLDARRLSAGAYMARLRLRAASGEIYSESLPVTVAR